jgi:hypothetical protein
MSATDLVRGEFFLRSYFNRMGMAYTYYQKGIFREVDYESWLPGACDLLKRDRIARIWADLRPSNDPEFVRDVESHCKQAPS